jgi:MFS family permease
MSLTENYQEPLMHAQYPSSTEEILNATPVASIKLPAHIIMAEGAEPGEYISRQRARESSQLRVCGCIRVQWLLLVCICFLTFGSYWVYDEPGALEDQFKQWFGHGFDNSDNALFYSVYSYPNIILPFISGIIIDQVLGVRWSSLLFICCILVGDCLFALGINLKIYGLAVAGRAIFGLGGESLTVAQNTYVLKWFSRSETAWIFGLVVGFSRVGTSVNFIVSPYLSDVGIPLTIWFGAGVCFVSFVMCIVACILDRYAENTIDEQRAEILAQLDPADQQFVKEEDLKHEPLNDEIRLTDVLHFPFTVFLLVLITAFFYVGILTFYTVAQNIITNNTRFTDPNTADLFISIPSFVAIVGSPFFGYWIDRVGRSIYWVIGAGCMVLIGHTAFILMAYEVEFTLAMTPIPVMIWIGVGYSMGASAVWPMLPLLVKKSVAGTGFGVMTAVQNGFLAAFPQIISALTGANGIEGTKLQYSLPTMIFMGCEGVAITLCIFLYIWDRNNLRVLSSSPAERDLIIKKREEDELAAEGLLQSAAKQQQIPDAILTYDSSINNHPAY